MDTNQFQDETICQHFFEHNSKYYGAVTPPIIQTTLFTFHTYEEFMNASSHERENHLYTRGVNPTTEILEKKIAQLECGEQAKVFSSGMGAISATLFTLLSAGDHILLVNNIYGPAVSYSKILSKYQVEYTNIYVEEAYEIEQHIKENTKLIYFESPSTQLMYMLDVETIVKIAHKYNILTMTDNTWSTPLYQKPITYGVDIVVHSCTKYIGGHSDVMAGVVVSKKEIVDQIFEIGHQFQGAVIGPFESWLLIRGLRTLAARLQYQQDTTKKIVELLQQHKKVKKVNHPLCFEGKQKQIADKYLKGYTSLLSFELDTNSLEDIEKVVNSCKIFQIGVSWGGFESLILPQFNGKNHEALQSSHLPVGLIRIYLGLEKADDLVIDLRDALNQLL